MRNMDYSARKSSWYYLLTLLGLVVFAGMVRFYDLDWDEGTHLHPDERYLTMVVSAVRFPSELEGSGGGAVCSSFWSCLGLYWNTAESPLNPASYDQFSNYVYGTLPLFTTRAAARWVDGGCGEVPLALPNLYRRVILGTTDLCAEGYYTGYSGIHLVGRSLSGLADLATLLGLVLLAKILYGRRTALLSGMLYALAPLPIQHAHFFVVDSFATVFVIWTLLFCVLSTKQKRMVWLIPAGLATGLAVASKASVWPLAAIVAVAGLFSTPQETGSDSEQHHLTTQITTPLLVMLTLSGAAAALAFRTTQPYAFSGPSFWNIGLNSGWLATMKDISQLMRGLRDVPFGHQWTARTPLLFPGRNMIVWGLGLPIGLAAWVGWGWMGVQLWWHKRFSHLLPWLWGTAFFLYQATQWVKSMRYLLPIYPVFILFAAWLATSVSARARSRKQTHCTQNDDCEAAVALQVSQPRERLGAVLRTLARVLPYLLVVGGLVWCFAFLSIYRNSLTRIEASRWMYDNIPTAVTLQTENGEIINVPWSSSFSLTPSQNVSVMAFIAPYSVRITGISLPKVSGNGIGGDRLLRASVGDQVVSTETAIPDIDSVAVSMSLDVAIDLAQNETVALELSLVEGPAIVVDSAVVANEHWDDPLPLRMEGRDAFWNWYQGLSTSSSGQINNYDDDTFEKRLSLLNWLDEADVIVLSSNRLYASIPRLPQRYPLTTEYYRLLLGGYLGFDLAAEFVSYAALGDCQFPDQEIPFPLATPLVTNAEPCSIDLSPAEEAFSVYDHPTVLIFRKNDTYSRAKAEALLPESLLADVQWMTPREATQGLDDDGSSLVLSAKQRTEQELGGTWSKLFNTNAIQNLSQRVAVVAWALFLTMLGWIAFPVIFLVFPDLRCRGYGLSRVIGLLIWSYIAWLLASLHILPFTRGVLWLLFVAMAGISISLARRHWTDLRALIVAQWRNMLAVDIVFLSLFLLWVGVRWMNPDLWHPVVGGEKPMDFAYFNAVTKSTWFPPYDPWFAGGKLNYYYFGFVLMGSLTKALGIVPSVAYNLAIPSLFALTGVGGYTLASNLAGGDQRRGLRAGIWGVVMVVILGNLGEVRLLLNGFAQVGNIQFESLIPGYPQAVSALVGIWKVVVKGASLAFRPEWWYWDATRIIPIDPGEIGPINEFPAFTFLYADLHAHAMALPLTQISLAIALQWALGTARRGLIGIETMRSSRLRRLQQALVWGLPQPIGSLLLAALAAGALRATNTWDYPTYLALMTIGFFIGVGTAQVRAREEAGRVLQNGSEPANDDTVRLRSRNGRLLFSLLTPVLLLVCAELLFRPFTINYKVPYAAFELWQGSRTPLSIYLLMYGPSLFPIAAGAVAGIAGLIWHRRQKLNTENLLWSLVALLTALVVLVVLIGYFEVKIAGFAVILGGAAVLLLIAPTTSVRQRLLWFWVGTALALSLLVEAAVLKGDIGRMNTVFKFHLQVWMLFAISAAVFVERLVHSPNGLHELFAAGDASNATAEVITPIADDDSDVDDVSTHHAKRITAMSDTVAVVVMLLVLGAGLYPAFAIPARIRDRWVPTAPHTLDGMAYMQSAVQYEHGAEIRTMADYRIIHWLQDNVEGSPTIIEAQAEREYLWGSRITIYTGLPSVAAWRWHQVQQRMIMPAGTVEARQQDVRTFYNSGSPERAREILAKYDVSYVILAPYERAYMLPEGLPKFTTMVEQGWLEIVYQDEDSTIYKVVE